MSYSCWILDEDHREALLAVIQPAFPDVIAHHVTVENPSKELPPHATIRAIGQAIDETGVQALVVEVTCPEMNLHADMIRPDGAIYHCTWSIDRGNGKKPFHSVKMLEEVNDRFDRFETPIWLNVSPTVVS